MKASPNNSFNSTFFAYSERCIKGGYIAQPQALDALDVIKNGKKGVILYGKTGTGKTLLLELLMRLLHPQDFRKFRKVYCLDQIIEFNTSGHDIFMKNRDKNVWFDDLGAEGKGYYYGDKFEVFERMVQIRYDLFIKGIITHFTTNLTPNEIKSRYGERMWSRLSQMCTHIIFEGQDKRTLDNFIKFIPVNHKPIRSKEDIEWDKYYHERKELIASQPQPDLKQEGIGTMLRKQLGEIKSKTE